MDPIPLLDLGPQHDPIHDELLRALDRVVRSRTYILGEEVKRFEERIAAYCGTASAVGVSSGTDALLVSLMALGIGPGDEVVTTAYSFFATAGVIARVGARPVFVDIDPATYNLDPAGLERAVTPRTRALLPVHLFGRCAEMDPILAAARSRRLPVIEDAAQAIGADYRGNRRAGGMGDLGCFSFFPSKNLGALGDAGMVVTNDRGLAERVRILRGHGAEPKYHHARIGGNFRLDALQAAVLNVKLGHLDGWTRSRRDNARRYDALFRESGLVAGGDVRLPEAATADAEGSHDHIYNQYVIRARDRDGLRTFLAGRGIATEVYYPVPLHRQECFRSLGYREGDFPEAERAARETLALPVYPGLKDLQLSAVVAAVRTFYEHGAP